MISGKYKNIYNDKLIRFNIYYFKFFPKFRYLFVEIKYLSINFPNCDIAKFVFSTT